MDAARDAADWAGWTWFLGLGGIFVGVGTLSAAIAAAFFAKKAADYTRDSATQAQRSADAAEVGIEPHVYFGDATVSLPFGSKSRVRVPIKNHGLSPALNVRFGHESTLVPRPILDQADALAVNEWTDAGALGPQADTFIDLNFADLSDDVLASMRNGEYAAVMRIVLRYEDRNGKGFTDETWIYVDQESTEIGDVCELTEFGRTKVRSAI